MALGGGQHPTFAAQLAEIDGSLPGVPAARSASGAFPASGVDGAGQYDGEKRPRTQEVDLTALVERQHKMMEHIYAESDAGPE